MKTIHYLCLLILLLCYACGGDENDDPTPAPDDEPTIVEQQLGLLKGETWVPGTITKDNQPLANEYPYFADFELSFSGDLNADKSNVMSGTYTTNDEGDVLPSGIWSFKDGAVENTLIMDGLDVNYTVNTTSLQLRFSRTANPNARNTAISGEYEFNLIPQ